MRYYWLICIKLVRWSASIGLHGLSDFVGKYSGLEAALLRLLSQK